jgi:hypothetical protein
MGKRKYSTAQLEALASDVADKVKGYWEAADSETRKAGRGWYPMAHIEARLMSEATGYTRRQTAAVIAVLSPLTRWAGNIEDAWRVIQGMSARHALPRNVVKAKRIMAGEPIWQVLGGKKVRSFYLNIAYPLRYRGTTNDSWMARGLGLDEREIFSTWGVYEAVTAGIQTAADELGELPNVLQAVAWVIIRETWERNHSSWRDNLPIPF